MIEIYALLCGVLLCGVVIGWLFGSLVDGYRRDRWLVPSPVKLPRAHVRRLRRNRADLRVALKRAA